MISKGGEVQARKCGGEKKVQEFRGIKKNVAKGKG